MSKAEQNDPLADLNLDTAAVTADAAPVTNETTENHMGTDYEFGDIEIATVKEVPAATRIGGGTSKFPFAKLEAPTDKGVQSFTVPFKGGDEKKFRRAVQSATTQANRSGKAEGKYFTSRSNTEAGKLVSITVYRTDDRPEGE